LSICLPSVIVSCSLCIYAEFTCFGLYPTTIIRYDERTTQGEVEKEKEGKKKKKSRRSRLSSIAVCCRVVTTIRRSSPSLLLLLHLLFSLPPSFNFSASPLVYVCGSDQFECMTKFGRASATRREESASVSYATIYRMMMMNTCRAGKQQRLLH
jgi:hypothetical protein